MFDTKFCDKGEGGLGDTQRILPGDTRHFRTEEAAYVYKQQLESAG